VPSINDIQIDACLIIDGIAFEAIKDKGINRVIATDLSNPSNKASFVIRGQDLILSVSSFREQARERALLEAVRINNALLIDEVQCA